MTTYRLLAGTCNDGPCPTLWIDDQTGDVLVQGYVTSHCPPVTVPLEEDVVRIPAAAWQKLLRNLQ